MANGKFVAYYRVSTQKQGASGLGLDAQREAVSRFLNGGDWEVIGEFVEVETGKGADALAKRPKLKEALETCRKKGAKLIIAKLDRLSRSVHFVSGLMESKVKFVACDMPEANELTIHIMAAFAEHEAKRISQRTKDALAVAKLRGVVLGKAGADNLRPNVEARKRAADQFAMKLRPIFESMRSRGLSQREIATELNVLEVPTATGRRGKWGQTQVRRVMELFSSL